MPPMTALQWSSFIGDLPLTRFLVRFGADVAACVAMRKPGIAVDEDVYDFGGCTALHVASLMGNMDCCDVLVNASADVYVKDAFGYSALMYIQLLRYYGDVETEDGYRCKSALVREMEEEKNIEKEHVIQKENEEESLRTSEEDVLSVLANPSSKTARSITTSSSQPGGPILSDVERLSKFSDLEHKGQAHVCEAKKEKLLELLGCKVPGKTNTVGLLGEAAEVMDEDVSI